MTNYGAWMVMRGMTLGVALAALVMIPNTQCPNHHPWGLWFALLAALAIYNIVSVRRRFGSEFLNEPFFGGLPSKPPTR